MKIVEDLERYSGTMTLDATNDDASLTISGNWIENPINATGDLPRFGRERSKRRKYLLRQRRMGQVLFNHSKQDNSSKSAGFKGDTVGAAFGVDSQVNDDVTLGIGYAYSKTDIDSGQRSINIEGHTLFGYAQFILDNRFVRGTLSYGMAEYDEKAPVAGLDIRSDYHVYTTAMSAIGGYKFDNGIIPEGGFRASRVSRNSYDDTSGQHIAKDNMNSLTLVAGSRFVKKFDGDFKWNASANAALTYDLFSENTTSVVTVGNSVYFSKGKRLNRLGAESRYRSANFL